MSKHLVINSIVKCNLRPAARIVHGALGVVYGIKEEGGKKFFLVRIFQPFAYYGNQAEASEQELTTPTLEDLLWLGTALRSLDEKLGLAQAEVKRFKYQADQRDFPLGRHYL